MPSVVSGGLTPIHSVPYAYSLRLVNYVGTPTLYYSNVAPTMTNNNTSYSYQYENNNDSAEYFKCVQMYCTPPPPSFPLSAPGSSLVAKAPSSSSSGGIPYVIGGGELRTPPPQSRATQPSSCDSRAATSTERSDSSKVVSSSLEASKLCYSDIPNSILDWIDSGLLEAVAKDRDGSRMLQLRFPKADEPSRERIFRTVVRDGLFTRLCNDVFGNFLIQKMLEEARGKEIDDFVQLFRGNLALLCAQRYSCRVVQKMFDTFETCKTAALVVELSGHEVQLSTDQGGSHVLQKIFARFPLHVYSFVVETYMADRSTLKYVVENKYGCRVVQSLLEVLEVEKKAGHPMADDLLNRVVVALVDDCSRHVTHQFANYVVQHILQSSTLTHYRNNIIYMILQNILSLSQEKFASHVVEKAFRQAPLRFLRAMMQEVFDGYETDEYGCDALDVMLFDQFGNYVVQTMLDVAIEVKAGERQGELSWFHRLCSRILHYRSRLIKYSSGKRLLEKLQAIGEVDIASLCAEGEGASQPCASTIPTKFR